jgi:TonB-dependent Receptor Plug Domain
MTAPSTLGICFFALAFLLMAATETSHSQSAASRVLSGVVVTEKDEVVPGATVLVQYVSGKKEAVTDGSGSFQMVVPGQPLRLNVVGKYLAFEERRLSTSESTEGLQLKVTYTIPPVHESLVISATALNPTIDQRNDNVYKSTLFSRDDQIFDTLAAGINAGQHEGGGKSLEIRRFGFNLDHGGVNGGLKVLVDDVQQNQPTQGHGQGYLGALKTLTPELVDDVDILNGPFSAEYGDFSGLGASSCVGQNERRHISSELGTFR